jgi:hypothetical protein
MLRVLWVEDLARYDYARIMAPVYSSGRYGLTIAADPTEAVTRIAAAEYDVVVVDIRLLPGTDERWIKWYVSGGENKQIAKLGLHLVLSLLYPDHAKVPLLPRERPPWLSLSRIGILSVEPWDEVLNWKKQLGLGDDVMAFPRDAYVEKGADKPRTVLLELIDHLAGGATGP